MGFCVSFGESIGLDELCVDVVVHCVSGLYEVFDLCGVAVWEDSGVANAMGVGVRVSGGAYL